MIVTGIKTRIVKAGEQDIIELLNEFVPQLHEGSVLVVTSKIVSLCENRTVPLKGTDKKDLVERESEYFIPGTISQYNYTFTVSHRTLIANAGIDESNAGGDFLLWPAGPQKTCNEIREHLVKKHGLENLGVVITDSSVTPLRYGTMGIVVAHSGFLARHDYRGQPDLFGREMKVSVSSVAGGLAAAGVTVMGEGTEQTPLAIIEDVPFVQFQDRNPTQQELDDFYIPMMKDDLFAPFLSAVKWRTGGQAKK